MQDDEYPFHERTENREIEAILFTDEEQLNAFLTTVIKDALNTAAENAAYMMECGKLNSEKCCAVFCSNCGHVINKESITNTFSETFNKWKL